MVLLSGKTTLGEELQLREGHPAALNTRKEKKRVSIYDWLVGYTARSKRAVQRGSLIKKSLVGKRGARLGGKAASQ